MHATSHEPSPAPRAAAGTPFERAVASRGAEYARAWLKKHGLRGRELARTVETLEEKLVEVVALQAADVVLLSLHDDGLAILATPDDDEAERWAASMIEGARGQFGLHLPALAREVRRHAEGRACRESCRH